MKKLIVGLGNPGARYKNTRHNAGFLMIDALCGAHVLECGAWRMHTNFNAEIAHCLSNAVVLAKPHTFMNESGRAVRAITHFYKIPPESLYVIHDDMDIKFGSYKIQKGRGSAGHRGVESIFSDLGTRAFTRIRIGIAPDIAHEQEDGTDFVLSKFTAEELRFLATLFNTASHDLLSRL